MTIINPGALGQPRGWSNGILAPANGRVLFVAGQTATDAEGRVVERGFVAQFDTALSRALAVLREAGGSPEHVGRMTVYVTDMEAYRATRRALGEVWTRHMGGWYPAMALVAVTALVDQDAAVEIEMTAVVPRLPEGGTHV
jgi:enamine deaminase RidA (YjgF/YER057c/UK114 family)